MSYRTLQSTIDAIKYEKMYILQHPTEEENYTLTEHVFFYGE